MHPVGWAVFGSGLPDDLLATNHISQNGWVSARSARENESRHAGREGHGVVRYAGGEIEMMFDRANADAEPSGSCQHSSQVDVVSHVVMHLIVWKWSGTDIDELFGLRIP